MYHYINGKKAKFGVREKYTHTSKQKSTGTCGATSNTRRSAVIKRNQTMAQTLRSDLRKIATTSQKNIKNFTRQMEETAKNAVENPGSMAVITLFIMFLILASFGAAWYLGRRSCVTRVSPMMNSPRNLNIYNPTRPPLNRSGAFIDTSTRNSGKMSISDQIKVLNECVDIIKSSS